MHVHVSIYVLIWEFEKNLKEAKGNMHVMMDDNNKTHFKNHVWKGRWGALTAPIMMAVKPVFTVGTFISS